MAHHRAQRSKMNAKWVLVTGVILAVTALVVTQGSGSTATSALPVALFASGVLCALIAVVLFELSEWGDYDVLDDQEVVRDYMKTVGGIGTCGGVTLYSSLEGVADLVGEYFEQAGLREEDEDVIRVLLLDGSDLTLGELVATATSLRS